jgi:hypothetical protein
MAALETDELTQRGAAGNAVDGKSDIALKFRQGARSAVSENSVDPPRVETQRAQSLLKVDYIVAAQHRRAAIEKAITNPKTGFDQRVPRLGSANTVNPEPSQMLEGLDGGPGGITEVAVGFYGRAAAEDGNEALLDICDCCSLVPEGEGETYRYSAISWSS